MTADKVAKVTGHQSKAMQEFRNVLQFVKLGE